MSLRQSYASEEDTRARLITPALLKAGWQTRQMLMEYSLKADRYRIVPGKNFTIRNDQGRRTKPDYILFRDVNRPLAVVEAKKLGKTARDGLDQAIAYAKLLDVPFAYASAGDMFLEYELPTGRLRELAMDAFPSSDELWKRWCVLRHVEAGDAAVLDKAQYHTSGDAMTPRYYQMQAINRTVDAIVAGHRRRALLVMATGTGKTYTAFQIIWRLRKAGVVKNVLYLADRNQLVEQAMTGDFAPFRSMYKIRDRAIDRNYEIYFGLNQQLKGGDQDPMMAYYRQVPADYFDLIVVDECHRGSADEKSSWRDILDYFSSAIQIGMTATPSDREGASNPEYFGAPLFTYSLKQGIEDGFLAPYQVVSVHLDRDVTGWEPEEGDVDVEGNPVPRRLYTLNDFDRTLEIKGRTRKVAEVVTNYLHHLGRMSKTIIFCATQRHAANMRDAIREHNRDMMVENDRYAVRMTADDAEGRALYHDFTSVNSPYPVVVTTSKLLTTGANTKCVKLIVLDSNIRSMTEFKQIIGRGTRLRPDAGKTFFTILDFRNACALFHDPEFDGPGDDVSVWSGEGDPPQKERPDGAERGEGKKAQLPAPDGAASPLTDADAPRIIVVDGVDVAVAGRSVRYLDENGNLVTEKYEEYTKRNILSCYGTDEAFREAWNGSSTKRIILDELKARGVLMDNLKKELGNPDLDEFDMIRHIAFGCPMLTRQLRANKVRSAKFLERYQGVARAVLERLLEAYEKDGIRELDGSNAIVNYGKAFGGTKKVFKVFKGRDACMEALHALQNVLYDAECA